MSGLRTAAAQPGHELLEGRRPLARPHDRDARPALVTGQLGHKYADELHGIHIRSRQKPTLFDGDRGWDISGGRPIPEGMPAPVHDRITAPRSGGSSGYHRDVPAGSAGPKTAVSM
jgi:hypothetical protein